MMPGAAKAARGRGLTLIQVLVALVAVAVVIAIAIPAYRTRALRNRRAEATQALRSIQAAEERYLVQFNRYAARLAPQPPLGLGLAGLSNGAHYRLQLDVDDPVRPSRFTARARAVDAPDGGDANCRSFSLDQNGIRTAQDALGADRTGLCWRE
jgi:type IV pilus assembly protein PilE